jgi:hypothetical protein
MDRKWTEKVPDRMFSNKDTGLWKCIRPGQRQNSFRVINQVMEDIWMR